jgi:hypothetical protein
MRRGFGSFRFIVRCLDEDIASKNQEPHETAVLRDFGHACAAAACWIDWLSSFVAQMTRDSG